MTALPGTLPAGAAAGAHTASRPSGAPAPGTRTSPSMLLTVGLLGYFVLEYVRPEPIVQLRLQMAFIVLVPVAWLASGGPWHRVLTLQSLFLAGCALSVPFSENYFTAYLSTREVFGHVMIALAISWLLVERRRFTQAIWFWVLVIGYQAVFAITHGGRGTGGFMGDENDLALACATAFPFGYIGFFQLTGWRRWASAGLAVLFTLGVVASFSRGGFLGLAATALFCVLIGQHRIRNLLVGAVAAGVFFLAIPSEYKSELSTIQETDSGTAEVRLFLWTAAFNMWSHNPVFGVGAGNSSWNVGRYQPLGSDTGLFSGRQYHARDWTMQQVHSLYFQLLSETGSVGVGLFAALVLGHFSLLRTLRRRGRREGLPRRTRAQIELYSTALMAAMVGYLAAGAFLSVAYYPYPWYLAALSLALAASYPEVMRPAPAAATPPAEAAPGKTPEPARGLRP